MLIRRGILALLLVVTAETAAGAPRESSSQEPQIAANLAKKDLREMIKATMPYPVLSIFYGKRSGRWVFTINMDIGELGLRNRIFHATIEVPLDADRNTLAAAFRKLALWTKDQLVTMLEVNRGKQRRANSGEAIWAGVEGGGSRVGARHDLLLPADAVADHRMPNESNCGGLAKRPFRRTLP